MPFVAQRLPDGGSQNNARVLHCVMIVNLQISMYPQTQVKQPVARKTVQHMVKKSHAGGNVAVALSVQDKLQLDLRLWVFRSAEASCHFSSSSNRTAMELAWAVSRSACAN